ncbi:amino acid adenylation enzyme/thioester reductase family protein [Microbacterium sp. HM58-2]|nr:amino acid adenylation enzyme/thioester reductase family protein [Microbacterium sp. HM58-2]
MTPPAELDLTDLPQFLARLGDRDAGAAALARQLLDRGWSVQSFWGPEQMDVWSLTVRREGRTVRFGIERGYVDPVMVASDGDGDAEPAYRLLSLAILGWARASGVDLPFPGVDLPFPGVKDFRPDLGAHGLEAIDWLAAGNDHVLARIDAAWKADRARRHEPAGRAAEGIVVDARARGIRAIEEAAVPR